MSHTTDHDSIIYLQEQLALQTERAEKAEARVIELIAEMNGCPEHFELSRDRHTAFALMKKAERELATQSERALQDNSRWQANYDALWERNKTLVSALERIAKFQTVNAGCSISSKALSIARDALSPRQDYQKTGGSGSGAASKTAEPGSTPGPGATTQSAHTVLAIKHNGEMWVRFSDYQKLHSSLATPAESEVDRAVREGRTETFTASSVTTGGSGNKTEPANSDCASKGHEILHTGDCYTCESAKSEENLECQHCGAEFECPGCGRRAPARNDSQLVCGFCRATQSIDKFVQNSVSTHQLSDYTKRDYIGQNWLGDEGKVLPEVATTAELQSGYLVGTGYGDVAATLGSVDEVTPTDSPPCRLCRIYGRIPFCRYCNESTRAADLSPKEDKTKLSRNGDKEARTVEQEERESDGKTEAELRDFYDWWGRDDGNSPGYNRDKAKLYGRIARHYKQALEKIVAPVTWGAAHAYSVLQSIAKDALAKDEFPPEAEVARPDSQFPRSEMCAHKSMHWTNCETCNDFEVARAQHVDAVGKCCVCGARGPTQVDNTCSRKCQRERNGEVNEGVTNYCTHENPPCNHCLGLTTRSATSVGSKDE